MHGTPPTHVVRTRTALPVRPKPPLMSRHYASMGLDVGMRACVLPTGKSPPLTPLDNKPDPNFSSEIKSHYCEVNGTVLTPQKARKQRPIEVKVSNITATIPMPALTPNRNVMRKVQQKREGTLPNTDASSHAWTYDELCALKSVPTHIIDDAPLLRQVAATAGGPACTADDWERLVDIKFKAGRNPSFQKSDPIIGSDFRKSRIFSL